jgi:hypothetical protein
VSLCYHPARPCARRVRAQLAATTCCTSVQKALGLLLRPPSTNFVVFAPGSPAAGARRTLAELARTTAQALARHASAQAASTDEARLGFAAAAAQPLFRASAVSALPRAAMLELRSNGGGVLPALGAAVRAAAAADGALQARLRACEAVRPCVRVPVPRAWRYLVLAAALACRGVCMRTSTGSVRCRSPTHVFLDWRNH